MENIMKYFKYEEVLKCKGSNGSSEIEIDEIRGGAMMGQYFSIDQD